MFADTLNITVNGAAKALVRVNQDAYSSEYRLVGPNELFQLFIRNTMINQKDRSTKPNRHAVEFTHTIYSNVTDGKSLVRKQYFVFEHDPADTLIDPIKTALGLTAFLTEANLTKLANFES